MGLKEDLERDILESYAIISENERRVLLSGDPREKRRARQEIESDWEKIKATLKQYLPLCRELGAPIREEIREIAIVAELRFGSLEAPQPPAKAGGPEPAPGPRPAPLTIPVRYRWGVLVGVNHYEDEAISALKVCVGDVRAVHELLTADARIGYDRAKMRLLVDEGGDALPTRAEVLGSLKAMASRAETEDMLFFYFSGHGMVKDDESYLLPGDARHINLADTAIPLRRVRELVEGSAAHAKVIVLDACHSGAQIGKEPVQMTEGFIRRVFEQARGIAVLASCERGQVSWEFPQERCSVFTYYLLEGLRGKADLDDKGFVTVGDISRYVSDQVQNWAATHAREQTPTLQYTVAGDIILVDHRAAQQGESL
jgi:hypothetical protein